MRMSLACRLITNHLIMLYISHKYDTIEMVYPKTKYYQMFSMNLTNVIFHHYFLNEPLRMEDKSAAVITMLEFLNGPSI